SMVKGELGDEWDAFVNSSPQGTVFSETVYLKNLKENPAIWWCLCGEEKAGAVIVIETSDGKSTLAYPNIIHNGVLLAANTKNQNSAQLISEEFRVLAYLSAELPKIYHEIYMTMHYSLIDMRPFIWYLYGEEGDKYNVDIRYTSLLDLSGTDGISDLNDSPIYIAANKSRRQQIRYGIKHGYVTEEATDLDLFLDLYTRTYERQSIETSDIDFEELKNILAALEAANRLRMFITRDAEKIVGSVALFVKDHKRWYYLFGASNNEIRDGHGGTKVLWDAFTALAEDEIKFLDLEGVNSPQRGYFKLSFGGELVPYYQVSLTR
ncbi:GNAT family N-acetyltransferase, partial [Rhodospirillales bacterium]|nr:GNAT family N-acetyltransferase [Rhodospirillales bacterium]